jgi:cathepsin A (carboxypeptidase C)
MKEEDEPICVSYIQECNKGDSLENDFACEEAYLYCSDMYNGHYYETGRDDYDITITRVCKPNCEDYSLVEKFMNLPNIKQKLHVNSNSPSWQGCNFDVHDNFLTDWMKDFSGKVADLLNDDIPVLIYAGDLDFICNYLGNKAWVTELDWKNGVDFKKAKDHDWNNGAGLAKTAGKLTFLQVYDAGHMVPTDQPEHALTMITQF